MLDINLETVNFHKLSIDTNIKSIYTKYDNNPI